MIHRNKNFKTVEGAIYKTKRKVKRRIRMNRVRGNVPIRFSFLLLFLLRINNISYIRQSIAFLRKRAARVTDLGAMLLWWMLSNGKWLVADVDDRRCPHYSGQGWTNLETKISVWEKSGQANRITITTSSLSKSYVNKMCSVHIKTQSRLFRIYPFWKAFSKNSVLEKDKCRR